MRCSSGLPPSTRGVERYFVAPVAGADYARLPHALGEIDKALRAT